MKSILSTLFTAVLLASCTGIRENPEITSEELQQHVGYLASDSLKGRYPGSPGDLLAARYIAGEFRKAGLSLLTRDGLQSFEVITAVQAGENNEMNYGNAEMVYGEDFSPFPFTANTGLEAEVVVAGYGFEIEREGLDWNDYDGLDADGKWVLILRGNPEIDSTESVFHEFSSERSKSMLAADHGAAGVLFVAGPVYSREDELTDLEKREGKISIPAINISRKLADRILATSGRTIEEIESKMNTERTSVSFSTGESLKASAEVKPDMATTYNVVAYLEGSDPVRKNDIIIMGAHYDHLGMGGPGSSSRRQDTVAVHNGADDNASGVAALIEVAEKIAGSEKSPANSYIFIAFGAEEMGLLGSKYYVEHPLMPLDQTRIMLNMDMVGRLRDQQLQVGGVGTAGESEDMVKTIGEKDGLAISTTQEGYGASDHSSFYGMDIPVLFVTTGAHTEYHTPGDDPETINFIGMEEVASYVGEIAAYIDSTNTPLEFREAGPKVKYSYRRGRRVVLGIMPDFTDNDNEPGMRVDNVNPGQPADLGGMKKGDYIMAIDGKPINGIYDYMYRLQKFSKGQSVVVTVKREDQTLDLLIQL